MARIRKRFDRGDRRAVGRWTVAATLSVGVLLAGRRRRSRSGGSRADGGVEATRRVDRSTRVAALAARAGATAAVGHARATFANVRHDAALAERWQAETAEQIAEELGDMKGVLMKLGQMASYMDPGLPRAFRDALGRLQDNVPGMAPAVAREVVSAELGAPPEQLFDVWDPVPFAAASIGQVHKAITHDGRAVAVKVQYPGVGEAIRADLASAALLFTSSRALLRGMDVSSFMDELRDRIFEELDYEREADDQEHFARAYAGHPHIHVPWVDRRLSARRVLTSELVDGAPFADAREWSAAERNLAGETIYRFVIGSLYRLRTFHGDPHPGNYLFHGGGRVTFLDFGLVKHFSAESSSVFERLTRAMTWDHDLATYRAVLEQAGFIPAGFAVDDAELESFFGHFYAFIAEDRDVTITRAFASDSVRRYLDPTGSHGRILRAANLPRDMVIIQRMNVGLQAVLAELEATANWRRVGEEAWPWSDRGPATELGFADQRWREARS